MDPRARDCPRRYGHARGHHATGGNAFHRLGIGSLIFIAGVAQLVGAFWIREWSGFFLSLLFGLLYVVLGLMFLRAPVKAELALTMLLACVLMVGGLFRIIGSLMHRFPHWVWTLVGGAINVVLGIMIWQQWPDAALWVIGLFVGIDLIFTGWTWVMLALSVKNLKLRTDSPLNA